MADEKQLLRTNRNDHIAWLREKYFSNPEQRLVLKKGDVIMHQGELNQRIYFVEQGRLHGHFKPDRGDKFKVFSTGANMFVGIYSFFAQDGFSYTTVTAYEDSVVTYLHRGQVCTTDEECNEFIHRMLPIIVQEIYLRQMKVVNNAKEKESAMKKLFQSEKMATLGQLAAGLAHELNNAIGVIHSQSEWLTNKLKTLFEKQGSEGAYHIFEKGLESGQLLSSSDIRKRKNKLVDQTGLSNKLAKRLARIDLPESDIKNFAKNKDEAFIDTIDMFWETGLALHDINVASDHTRHVIQSIKDLGAQSRTEMITCDLGVTVRKSITLLSNLAKRASLKIEVQEGLWLVAREGDLIQVWLNIIKNGLESVLNAKVDKPEISISSYEDGSNFGISIVDNGPGIPEGLKQKIFQPNVTTKVHGLSFGLGLGLAIVQKIVNSYGGQIKVASEPGHTEFKVEFPKSN